MKTVGVTVPALLTYGAAVLIDRGSSSRRATLASLSWRIEESFSRASTCSVGVQYMAHEDRCADIISPSVRQLDGACA